MIKHGVVYDPIFRASILFCLGNQKECIKYIKERYTLDDVDIVEREFADGLTWRAPKKCVVWLEKKSEGILVHEIVHAVHSILQDCGITQSEETDEVFAYMTEFYFEQSKKILYAPNKIKKQKGIHKERKSRTESGKTKKASSGNRILSET